MCVLEIKNNQGEVVLSFDAKSRPEAKPEARPEARPSKPSKPAPIKRAIHYTKAVAEWVAKGLPERTQEEVESILSTYCKPCDWHDNGVCKGCGCNVNELRFAILNKIKMKTQHCPKGLW